MQDTVVVTPSANPVCEGTGVTFSAMVTNGDVLPVYNYKWKVNGTYVSGATNAT